MILPQGENFTILKNRLKCVIYFNAISNSQTSSPNLNLQDSAYKDLLQIYELCRPMKNIV